LGSRSSLDGGSRVVNHIPCVGLTSLALAPYALFDSVARSCS